MLSTVVFVVIQVLILQISSVVAFQLPLPAKTTSLKAYGTNQENADDDIVTSTTNANGVSRADVLSFMATMAASTCTNAAPSFAVNSALGPGTVKMPVDVWHTKEAYTTLGIRKPTTKTYPGPDPTDTLPICRVLTGLWQASGAHGYSPDIQGSIRDMNELVESGFTTFDAADIYGPAEELVGSYRTDRKKAKDPGSLDTSIFLTKWVPPPKASPMYRPMTKQYAEGAIDRSLQRMRTDRIDLLQFHWWDLYSDPSYLDALEHLTELKYKGKIRHIGLTNFDTKHMVTALENKFEIVSNQIQFSLLDQRPLKKMVEACKKYDVQLLAYGALGGGLLVPERYLGAVDPATRQNGLNTASLRKYYQMIQAKYVGRPGASPWDQHQRLLRGIDNIARKHGVSGANVAARWVLQQPQVGGVILGSRIGREAGGGSTTAPTRTVGGKSGARTVADQIEDNKRVFSFSLDEDDMELLQAASGGIGGGTSGVGTRGGKGDGRGDGKEGERESVGGRTGVAYGPGFGTTGAAYSTTTGSGGTGSGAAATRAVEEERELEENKKAEERRNQKEAGGGGSSGESKGSGGIQVQTRDLFEVIGDCGDEYRKRWRV